jgi:hypothetical protein
MNDSMAPKDIAVPAAIKTKDTEKLMFVWAATSTQNYECKTNAHKKSKIAYTSD